MTIYGEAVVGVPLGPVANPAHSGNEPLPQPYVVESFDDGHGVMAVAQQLDHELTGLGAPPLADFRGDAALGQAEK